MMLQNHPLAVFTAAALLSGLVTWMLVNIPPDKNPFIREQKEERWKTGKVSLGGGIAISAAFLIGLLVNFKSDLTYIGFILGCSFIFFIGLADDLKNIPAHKKLLLQIAAACIAVGSGIQVRIIGTPILNIPITILWIVGITNAFNLLDNMDGLSAGIAFISAFFIYLMCAPTGGWDAAYPAILLAGCSLGFLFFNFHPAKIFMGDCGSLLLGYALACISIMGTWQHASNLAFMLTAPILILGVPIFDTTLVTIQRKLNARPVSSGGKDHSSHRLVLRGYSESTAVLILYSIAALCGTLALLGMKYDFYITSLSAILAFIVLAVFGLYLSDAKVYGDTPTKHWKIDSFNTHRLPKRRLLEILLDLLIFCAAYFSAYLLRYDGIVDDYNMALFVKSLPWLVAIKLSAFAVVGIYSGVWRYIVFSDIYKFLGGSLLGSVGFTAFLAVFYRMEGFSRALIVIDFLLTFFMTMGARVGLRALRESVYAYPKNGKKVMLVGAGETGGSILMEIRKHRELGLLPVAIVDDDPNKIGKKLLGVPVVGPTVHIPKVVENFGIEKIIVAMPSASKETISKVETMCRSTGKEPLFAGNIFKILNENL